MKLDMDDKIIQDIMLEEFAKFKIGDRLMILSRLIHGSSISYLNTIYDTFINNVKQRIQNE